MDTPTPSSQRRSWAILAVIILCLPLAFLGLKKLFDVLGIEFHVEYVVLGLWFGLGMAASVVFRSRLTDGNKGSASLFASTRWFFVGWSIILAGLLAWILIPGYRRVVPVVQVFLSIGISLWILRNRHRGHQFTIPAIIVGAATIALFSAISGLL